MMSSVFALRAVEHCDSGTEGTARSWVARTSLAVGTGSVSEPAFIPRP